MVEKVLEAQAASSPHPAAQGAAPAPERPRPRAPAAVKALIGAGIALAATLGAGWLFRMPLADALIRWRLAAMGVEADFDILSLDFAAADLARVRLGPAAEPAFTADRIEARLAWSWLAPQLDAVRLRRPLLRARWSDTEGFAIPGLVLPAAAPGPRPTLPATAVTIEDGVLILDTPFGLAPWTVAAQGRIGADFAAEARLGALEAGEDGTALAALRNPAGAIQARIGAEGLVADIRLQADAARWADWSAAAARLDGQVRAPRDLARIAASGALSAGAVAAPGLSASGVRLTLSGDADMGPIGLNPSAWRAQADGRFAAFEAGDLSLNRGVLTASADGAGDAAQGRADLRAGQFAFGALRSADAHGAIAVAARLDGRPSVNVNGVADLPAARLSPDGLRFAADAWPDLGGLPIAPLMARGEDALVQALSDFAMSAPFALSLRDGVGVLSLERPISLIAGSGARIDASPLRSDAAMFTLRLADGDLDAAAAIAVRGGGLPTAQIALEDMAGGRDAPLEASGGLTIAEWRDGEARLSTEDLDVSYVARGGGGGVTLRGAATMSGPAGGAIVRDLTAPLAVRIDWGPGFRVAPLDGPIAARVREIEAPGFVFQNARLRIAPGADGAFVAANAQGAMSGGFAVDRIALEGRAAGADASPARFTAARVAGRFGGDAAAMRLDLDVAAPALAVTMAPDRILRFDAAHVTATNFIENGTWRLEGRLEDGALVDPATPATASRIALDFEAAPDGDQAIIRFANGETIIAAAKPADPNLRPLFNPLLLREGAGAVRDGVVTATGALAALDLRRQPDADGDGAVTPVEMAAARDAAKPLGAVDARHVLQSGDGEAHVRVRDLAFNAALQPYEISELARGLIENVRGAIDADIDAAWGPSAFRTTGRLAIRDASLSTKTIPIIEGVDGEIIFDDLALLTTPPGQSLAVSRLNPGVSVGRGAVRFQLLPQGRIALEGARFAFAGGELSAQPAEITIGAEETRFILTLAQVDVATLLAELNTPDLRATGTVEGTFPLLLTPRSAIIENGELRTVGGGDISYVGTAGDGMTGPAALAFEALRAFQYDDLSLTLNGDLSGDVITAINFHGRNAAAADLGAVAQAPGGLQLTARGIPFAFNVRVSAPFRRLADAAASITDVTSTVSQAIEQERARAEGGAAPPSSAPTPPE